jgi:hypothetical protein
MIHENKKLLPSEILQKEINDIQSNDTMFEILETEKILVMKKKKKKF